MGWRLFLGRGSYFDPFFWWFEFLLMACTVVLAIGMEASWKWMMVNSVGDSGVQKWKGSAKTSTSPEFSFEKCCQKGKTVMIF